MISFTPDRLHEIIARLATKRVAIIGDVMLDRYYWGNATRISPEAPVPVVDVVKESNHFGGASNVGFNVRGLGATAVMFGVVGDDLGGQTLRTLFNDNNIITDGVIVDSDRPTTVKTRIIANHQHVVRIDHETKQPISAHVEHQLLSHLSQEMSSLDCIILEDYNKGVMTKHVIHETIRMAREAHVPVMVDPKFAHFFDYVGVTLFKPNRKEVRDALGSQLFSSADIPAVGRHLLERLQVENVLVTLGEEGMMLFEKNEDPLSIPTHARSAADVSGAGDTVIATLAATFAAGASMKEAAMLANIGAGVVVEVVGVVPISIDALLERALAESQSENIAL